jgi:two-component system cell cycle response regulator
MSERRTNLRGRTLKGGKIIIGKLSVIDCVIRDLTQLGARLKVDNTTDVPNSFELQIKPDSARRPASVVWRGYGEIGIKFEPA